MNNEHRGYVRLISWSRRSASRVLSCCTATQAAPNVARAPTPDNHSGTVPRCVHRWSRLSSNDSCIARGFRLVFELVDRELTFCEGVLDQATPQQLGATFGSMRTSGRARAMRGSIAEPGPEAGLALAIALRAGIDADGAVDFARLASRIFGRLQPPELATNERWATRMSNSKDSTMRGP
jgi:hypothetical protein